jgi:hypothetical protein
VSGQHASRCGREEGRQEGREGEREGARRGGGGQGGRWGRREGWNKGGRALAAREKGSNLNCTSVMGRRTSTTTSAAPSGTGSAAGVVEGGGAIEVLGLTHVSPGAPLRPFLLAHLCVCACVWGSECVCVCVHV